MSGAQSSIPFHAPFAYPLPEGANLATIAVASDGTVVLVTQVTRGGVTAHSEFRCTVGTCANGTITFHYAPTEFFRFDGTASGIDVSIDDNQRVVFVFNDMEDLWYVTGRLGAGHGITWNDGVQFDSGDTPSVAVSNSGGVLEAHRSSSDSGTVFYHYGSWNGPVIDGFHQHGKDLVSLKVGAIDAVSAAVSTSGVLVVGWSGGVDTGSMPDAINGTLQGEKVNWHYLQSQAYASGYLAHLSIADNGRVVATYIPFAGFENLNIRYITGMITDDGKKIAFDKEAIYGESAALVTNSLSPGGNYVVLLYQNEDGTFLAYADLF
jgi:hypothetical protein